ncbi:response regulator transcription factor [Novosphingobium sp. G106]|uniref:response regulator transcription factor n=1 Tax=Novosphingobium sp. G106 TaxID=2849500 RepID=UPI001C2D49D7|nr:response regulator transcription factor [Novosphingobium sp. G106]MBV1689317.1 response regulator transcription factor [Novosphingobium sp. G106]
MRVLLAEDDDEAAGYVERGLEKLGHRVVRVSNGEEALQFGTTERFDMIVLDRMMPKREGLDVLRGLRSAEIETPVLVLTAMGGISDRVDGLDAGADDYLVKPFDISELVARMNALLRRAARGEATRIEIGDIAIDLIKRRVTRDGRQVTLQHREFTLLELLMRNAGRPVTRKMFLEQVWGYDFDPKTNVVESHLSRLRAKLRDGFADDPIETVIGQGYRMRVDAQA